MPGPIAVLDACVLYPAALRDLLLRLSRAGVYRARLTDRIHDEWIAALLANRPDLSQELLARTRRLMNMHALDSLVTGYEHLIEQQSLPDPDDRHVLAAAIASRARAIVTFNIRDFPAAVLAPFGISAIPPDDFICDLWDLDAEAVISTAREHRLALKNPPVPAERLLQTLQDQGLPETVARLREWLEEL